MQIRIIFKYMFSVYVILLVKKMDVSGRISK